MSRTNEELEAELSTAMTAYANLLEHTQHLAEAIRLHVEKSLPNIRELNDTYKLHATFMTEVEQGMREYVERSEGT